MALMDHEAPGRRHPLIGEAQSLARRRLLSRRGFLRIASLLGAGVGVGAVGAAKFLGQPRPASAQDVTVRAGPAIGGAEPKFGGVLRCAMGVHAAADPATAEWTEPSNQVRHQQEHLTITGPDNLTRPMLAERWAASDDLKTWTFFLRPGVRWHNGDAFTTEDVAFSFSRWLDPAVNSSNIGLFAAMVETIELPELDAAGRPLRAKRQIDGSVEIVDDLTIRLHLSSPVLSMPENLYNYPTAIVHRGFSGDVTQDRNGTGPYQIVENIAGEISISRKAQIDGWRYWGGDVEHIGPGYVDEIQYRHVDRSTDEALSAFLQGAADLTYEIGYDALEAAQQAPNARLLIADTAQTGCFRMRIDEPPFTDARVRKALQLSCDPDVFPDVIFGGRGRPGEHHHVAPIHPDYFPLRPVRRNLPRARRLLAEAGRADGVDVTLDVGNTSGAWQQRAAELLKAQAFEAGIRITVNVVSPDTYYALWRTTPFGLTQWTHRPLGTMALSLGYRSDVPWNETGYANPAFDAALTEAEALLDISARRDAMEPVERILQDDAVIVQPVWVPVYSLAKDHVRGLSAHPTQYHQFNGVWLDG